jgi:hypothetical protein
VSVIGDKVAREFEATFLPERYVDEHNIRPKRLSLSLRLRACRGYSRNRHSFTLEERPGRPEEASTVVDDQAAEGHRTSVAAISR